MRSQLIFFYITPIFIIFAPLCNQLAQHTAMKKYDFDEIIPRRGTNCLKYDLPEVGDRSALWIADMDFRTPDFIIDAMHRRLEHPVLGYTFIPPTYFELISKWVEDLHGWKTDKDWIRYIPGIVKGIGMVLCCFCNPGDKVIIMPPVYHPFRLVPEKNGLDIVRCPLKPKYNDDGTLRTYEMDFDCLQKVIDSKTKVLIMSNPHNPCGICWPESQLRKLARICAEHNILVISDEIHAEMAFEGHRHIPFASVSKEAAHNSITFLAPSKTFNIAGVVSSYTIVPDDAIREKFFRYLDANEFDSPTIMSVVATEAAYTYGREWRKQMLDYVQSNIDYVDRYIKENIPQIHCVRPDASFLIWLDCRKLGLSQEDLVDLFANKACIYLNDGEMFGEQGRGFMRLNVGCPRSILESALKCLADAVRGM